MSPSAVSPLASIKALTFDVFGTTVDWRSSVTDELQLRFHRKLNADAADSTLSDEHRERLAYLDENYPAAAEADTDGAFKGAWTARLAAAWRQDYWLFVKQQARAGFQESGFTTIDAHMRESLVGLLEEWQLEDVFSDAELDSLALVWHRLSPWPDTVEGLGMLNAAGYTTATLSNGNAALVKDLNDFGELGFQKLFCSETFKAYKPARETYEGAARELGLETGQVAMVAAHMSDLEAARSFGMRTVYVERRDEEAWPKESEQMKAAREWVDLWVKEDEGGFVALAKKLAELRA